MTLGNEAVANATPIEILHVEDDPGDVLLTKKAISNAKVKNNMCAAKDGVEAPASKSGAMSAAKRLSVGR